MGLNISQMEAAVLKATATDSSDWENGLTDIDLYINKSWWDIMDQFDFREKEAPVSSFNTIAGTIGYDIPSKISPLIFDAIQRVVIIDPISGQHTDLILISDFDYENKVTDDISQYTMPTNYFRRDNLLNLYPTPDTIYKIEIYYLQILGDLSVQAPIIPQSWHEIIESGAKYRALQDLQDFDKSSYWMNYQAAKINSRTSVKSKELADTKLAGVQIPGRSYP